MEKKVMIEDYNDLSNERGFQFEFHCALCDNKFKSEFVKSRSYSSSKTAETLGNAASLVGNFLGGKLGQLGHAIDAGTDFINGNKDGSDYDKEKEKAFIKAEKEAETNLFHCSNCERWVCEDCYVEAFGLCRECMEEKLERDREEAEREKEEIAAANICPKCGKSNPEGMRFCGYCGANISGVKECPHCGTENPIEMKFCGNCGKKL